MKNDVRIDVNLGRLGLSTDKRQSNPNKGRIVADVPEVWGGD